MNSDDDKERRNATKPTGDTATGPASESGAQDSAGNGLDGKDGQDGKEMRDAIGKRLKTLYDSIAREPVPERFADLLKQLRNNEERSK